MSELLFKKNEIDEAEKDFQKLTLNAIQRGMITAAAQIYVKYLPISELAIKGFISFAMRDYQVQNQIDLSTYLEWPPEEQAKTVWAIADLLKARLTKSLIEPEQEPILKKAITEAVTQALQPPK
jgi:hypothetical protein